MEVKHQRSKTIRQGDFVKKETKTSQQLLLEMEAFRTRLDATVFY